MHFYTNVYQHRNLILVREFKDGEYVQKQVQYKPTFYVPTNKDSSFRSVKGQNLEPKKFNSIAQARQFREKWREVEVKVVPMSPIWGGLRKELWLQ